MTTRREQLLDAAITVLGERGIHALSHRAVDTQAGLPAGSSVVLHEMAIPDPRFDPTDQITTLVTTVIRPQAAEVPS